MTAHCTLTSSELATRGARWRALAPTFVKAKDLENGFRLVFRPEPGVEGALRELAGLESDCCAFASWRVHVDDCCVLLDVLEGGDSATRLRSNLVAALTRRL
jgi:hypothetical protein